MINLLSNHKAEQDWDNYSLQGRSYKIGQVVGSYPSFIHLYLYGSTEKDENCMS